MIANIKLIGIGIGQLRVIETIDGKQIIERLDAIDNSAPILSLHDISVAFRPRTTPACFEVKPKGAGSSVEWRSQYLPERPRARSS